MVASLTAECRAFLLKDTRTGKLATVRADGRPHVAPIWFVLDGDTLVFNTGRATVKGANLLRTGKAAICVDEETVPYAYAMIEGTTECSENLTDVRYWATRIAARYMGEDRAEEYGARNGVEGEMLVRLTPTKVIFLENISD
ncbi:PPOX class F420-dependent oxidoreductase [Dictyobacter kobayashii]|uniref:PPOX class F420-dependent enzyme n=1 Tax=Dictyobacter kobayashii TaxID=2014872 RepID=A0A402ALL0_9CHLR|nr:PPOX class F420-dependent oxidoreductase [Dictyobacter kobayashii]GCE19993.1 PPOX class F420-dependent enzyme [Dictyobacter kobayashii]